MFIRRKPNKTGSVSVQVISKHTGKYQVVRSFGVGYSEQELVRLEEYARGFIVRKQNFVGELFSDQDEVRLDDFVSTIDNAHVRVVGPELIFGRLYDQIGYCKIENELFRHLVISRLFSPGSKLKTIDYLDRYHGIYYSIPMNNCADGKIVLLTNEFFLAQKIIVVCINKHLAVCKYFRRIFLNTLPNMAHSQLLICMYVWRKHKQYTHLTTATIFGLM